MEKATRQQTKNHNSRLVLKTIYNGGEVSRAEVARLTGLTRPTVSTIVTDLLNSDLVIEIGQGPSAGGKRPTLLSVNGDGRHLLAVDLSGDEFRAARLNLTGTIEARATLPAAGLRGEEALACVYQLIETLLPTSSPLLGIGVATPGLVDPHDGIVLRAVNLGWVGLPLRDLLEARFRHPVYVANDSHMAALAEYTFGDETTSENLIVIRVGRGIGAGIILSGRPFYGDGFGAGEIGHVVVDPAGELCTCGNRGCLEATSSIRAVLSQADEAERTNSLLAGAGTPTWRQFVDAVVAHDPVAADIAVRAGCHLGTAVAHLVGAYNVRNIVLAGRIADLDGVLLDAVVAEMHQRVLPSMAETTTVRFTSLGVGPMPAIAMTDIVTLGCSALLLHRELGIV
jgi:predicted NBD/HSP70 family sugar kinase